MKKQTEQTKKDAPQQEVNENLNDSEVRDLLIELRYSSFWPAIMTYYRQLLYSSDQVMRSVDPFKNPTEVARNQGFYSALSYLEVFINEEIKKRNEEEEKLANETREKK